MEARTQTVGGGRVGALRGLGRRLANVMRLAGKELSSIKADPVLVLLIAYAFTYAVYAVATGAKTEAEDMAVAVVDEDRSDLSRRIRDAFLPPLFKAPAEIGAGEIDAALDAGRFVFVVVIPPSFAADVLAGRNPSLQVNVDATAMTQAGNGAVYVQSIVVREVAAFLRRAEGTAALPVDLVVRARFNPNLRSSWFTAVMQVINNITMLSVILTGAALIREREHGTVEHLLVMPVLPVDIMLAKILANGLVIVAAASLSLAVVVEWLLAVPIAGSLALFLLGACIYQFSVAALGILLATFSTSMAQFGLLAIPVLVVLNLLSGSTTPLESMPVWLQQVMQVSPATRFVAFSQGVLYRGAGLAIVWPELLALAAIGAFCFGLSLKRFRRVVFNA
ncbi:ABC transporter permease [Chelatococcus sp. SYSU_G07232]|uniref:ABC transporter permease n=1 Tax=Chelatococcus albus TaxID=3047466 RepID=A0ABT7AND7_9HYPH|nr:ABC transporter permease [Chelatococcus sp. SYSU_G07232]MDJ1160076.1 ABC transporter permease [Chelatococcus sp. SYSU_G07232]